MHEEGGWLHPVGYHPSSTEEAGMPLGLRRKLFTKAAAAQQVTDWMPRLQHASLDSNLARGGESRHPVLNVARRVRLHHSARKRIEYSLILLYVFNFRCKL